MAPGREGGHTANRIVHAADATGEVIELSLLDRVKKHANIQLCEYHFAVELLTNRHLGEHVSKVRPDID